MRSGGLVVALTLAACGRVGFDPRCELGAPCVRALSINGGEPYARGPRLEVSVVVSGEAPIEVRLAEARADGNCQAVYADDGWRPYATPGRFDYIVEPTDGIKKLCAWAKDARGATSVIAGQGINRVDVATIGYAVANLPVIEAFEVVNATSGGRTHAAGELMRVSWTVTDVEALADSGLDLEYTTQPVDDDAWAPLALGIGGELDDPTRVIGSAEVPAPTAEPFLVRLIARDAAGNRGIPAISDAQNADGWSVYAGSLDRGIGMAARAARLEFRQNANSHFAVDPVSHDVYAADHGHGVVKLDARTGEVSRLIGEGPPNLPDDGPLPPDASLYMARVRVGPDRMLYVASGEFQLDLASSRPIYQIDPVTLHCRRFVGGGAEPATSATPQTVFLMPWLWDFDPEGNIYFLSSCDPANIDTAQHQLVKGTRGPDGQLQSLAVIAGSCAGGSPPGVGPQDPLAVQLGIGPPGIGTVAAWDAGRVLYFGRYGNDVLKIIDGVMYHSNIEAAAPHALSYDPTRGVLYAADNAIVEYLPNLAGPDGDLPMRSVVASDGTGRCADDGILAETACARVQFALQPTPERLYFLDGPGINEDRSYRIRFVDGAGSVQTYLGSPPFHGAGLDRRLLRGGVAGIHYKGAGVENQAAFPAGLYFVDPSGLLFGRIDAATGTTSVEWGTQTGTPIDHMTGTPIGADVGLGVSYGGGNLRGLGFDADGLPWLRYGPAPNRARLVRIDAQRHVIALQTGTADWESAPTGTSPRTLDLWPYGGITNFALRTGGAFLLGGYVNDTPAPVIRLLDFAGDQLVHVMGSAPSGYTPDQLSPGSATAASLDGSCLNDSRRCFVHYRASEDRLYFSEGRRVRYVTTPATPSSSTLVTLWTHPTSIITNFTFRLDGTQLFYVTNERLYCHDLTSGAAWCDDSVLGPPALLGEITPGADQLSWRDESTLLISTHKGQVLELTLPP